MKHNSNHHIHFSTHYMPRFWKIYVIQLLVILVILPQFYPLIIYAEPQKTQHQNKQDYQSAWNQIPVQNHRLNAIAWSLQIDHNQKPPSIRRTSLQPRLNNWQDWGAFPNGEAYSAPYIAFNQLWVWSKINTEWVLHAALLDQPHPHWQPVSTISKFNITEFQYDEHSNPLVLGVDTSGKHWLQRGDILGDGKQITWNPAYQIPESEFKRIHTKPHSLSPEFYNIFSFNEPVSFLTLAINTQGHDLLFRYRTAPHPQAPFGAWSQFFDQNAIQLDATGHFLQYHVVSKNNTNWQNRLPIVSLTYSRDQAQSSERVQRRGGGGGGNSGSGESSPISSNTSSAAQENPDLPQNQAESAEQKPDTPSEFGTNSPNESENRPNNSDLSDQTTPPNLANSPETNSQLSNESEQNNTNLAESTSSNDPADSTSKNDAAIQPDSHNSPANNSQQQTDRQASDQEQTEQEDQPLDSALDSSNQPTSSAPNSGKEISPQKPNESSVDSAPLEPNQANQPSNNNAPNQSDHNNQLPESQSSSTSPNSEVYDSPQISTNKNNELGNQEKQENLNDTNTQSDIPSHTTNPQNQTPPQQSEHEGDSRDINPSKVETPQDSPQDSSPKGSANQAPYSNRQLTQDQTNNSQDGRRSRSPNVQQATPTVTPSTMGRSQIGDLGNYENEVSLSGLWWLMILVLLPILLYLLLHKKSKSIPSSAKPDEEALTLFDSDHPLDAWDHQWDVNQQVQSVVMDDKNIGFLVDGKTFYLGVSNELLITNAHQNNTSNLKKYTFDHYYHDPNIVLNKSKLLILEYDERDQAQLYLYSLTSTDKPLKGKRLNAWKQHLKFIDDFWCHGSMLWIKGSESDSHSDHKKLVRGTFSKHGIAHWQLETPDDLQNNMFITASRSLEPIIAGVPRHDAQTVWFYAQNVKGHWRPFSKMAFQGDEIYLFSDPKNMALIELTHRGNNTFHFLPREESGKIVGKGSHPFTLPQLGEVQAITKNENHLYVILKNSQTYIFKTYIGKLLRSTQ